MSLVTGPISTMPGHCHKVPEGTKCDYHKDRFAAYRVQGETDSMGCEMEDLCTECKTKQDKACLEADSSGTCDWCKGEAPQLVNRRDYDEGMSGPIYRVCMVCTAVDNKRVAEEYEEYYKEDPFYNEFDD